MLKPGDKVHVIFRRLFDGDLRRHFAGEVEECSDVLARVRGHAYIFDLADNSFVRRPEIRTRILSLTDAHQIINILPVQTSLEDLVYRINQEGHLVVTDRAALSLDVNEFGTRR